MNEVWTKCIKMWEWIVENLEFEDLEPYRSEHEYERMIMHICRLKAEYLNGRGLQGSCHFCEADDAGDCSGCPGRLVDHQFSCADPAYTYNERPRAFLKELKRLNAIRLEG